MGHWLRLVQVGLAVAVAGVLWARPGQACELPSCQSDGAVALPGGFDISLPFAEGERVNILSGYGPNAGSSLHCRARDSMCANDWYALDLTLADHPNAGKGQPVLAIASGTILDAGWGSEGWANYGQRVYIVHDFNADGHKYVSMYAHLDSVSVSNGQKVQKGAVLGTLGQSCLGSLSCSSFSTPHVHFSIHRDSGFGGTGSGGSYGGRSVIPEPIDGHTGIGRGQVLTSQNGSTLPPPSTGCNLVIPPSGLVLEEDGPCGRALNGPLREAGGHQGHSFFDAVDVPEPDYVQGMLYELDFEQAGRYELFAWMPAEVGGRTGGAIYKVQHGTGATKLEVDQASVSDDWLPLGSFDFAQGGDQWVRLGDNYSSAAYSGMAFAMDALRVAPSSAGTAGAPGVGGAPGTGGATGAAGAAGATGSGWPDAGGWPSGDGSNGSDPGSFVTAGSASDSGCACSTQVPRQHSSWLAVLGLGVGLLVARRKLS